MRFSFSHLSRWLIACALLFVVAGCDSDDDDSDADVFLGSWVVTNVEDDRGSQTDAILAILESLTFEFENDGSFEANVDYNEAGEALGREDLNLSGTYTVNEAADSITLNVTGLTQVPFNYTILSEDQVRLSTIGQLINSILGVSAIEGTAVITVTRT